MESSQPSNSQVFLKKFFYFIKFVIGQAKRKRKKEDRLREACRTNPGAVWFGRGGLMGLPLRRGGPGKEGLKVKARAHRGC